jgi:hypothetical protein
MPRSNAFRTVATGYCEETDEPNGVMQLKAQEQPERTHRDE